MAGAVQEGRQGVDAEQNDSAAKLPKQPGMIQRNFGRGGKITMAFTAQDVKDLREMTGVGMMDCKKALTESGGDMEKAIIYLREKGLAAAQKKAGRIAAKAWHMQT